MAETLIKSRDRVQSHGEVFTPDWMVKKMLSEPSIQEKLQDLHATFLEPGAGEGAFLVEILSQKLDHVDQISSKTSWPINALWALASIYGIELLQDNLHIARKRMLDIVANRYKEFLGKEISKRTDFYKAAEFLIDKNIVQGNVLTYKTNLDELIMFNDWQVIDSKHVKREPFTFKSMVDGSESTERLDEQLDLFSLDENPEPKKTEYSICLVTKIYKEEKEK